MKRHFRGILEVLCGAGVLLSALVLLAGCDTLPVVIELDNITQNTTLRAGTYIARKNISVSNGATLTIQPGVKIIFEQGRTMTVDSTGKIHAVGTEARPILFTGDISQRGYWGGLRLYNTGAVENRLEYVTIEYGGGHYDGNLFLTGMSANPVRVAINHCTFRHSGSFGLATYGTAHIDEFEENTLTANADGAASLDVDHIGFLKDTSSFTGNDVDIILASRGNVNADAVWPGVDAPFLLSTSITVNAALEINPGAVMQFDAGRTMTISSTGSLAALGTLESPIFFTGADFLPGYWGGLRFNSSNSLTNELSHAVFEYGGGYYSANVYVIGTSSTPSRVAINNCFFRYSKEYGLSTYGGVILGAFENNVLTENVRGAVLTDADHVGFLHETSSFSGNDVDAVRVERGNVDNDAIWPAIDVPYYLDRDVSVNADLVIAPGAVLAFNSGRSMTVRSTGSLNANGTATDYIFFTGVEATPGYWGGLRIYNSNTIKNDLSYVVFEYGGGYYDGNLYLTGSTISPARAVVRNCIFRNSARWGIRLHGTFHVNADIAAVNLFETNMSGDIIGL